MIRISYWIFPVLSGLVWLGMLLGMLLGWIIVEHKVHYSSMYDGQTVAYISNIGASSRFKPMFIAMCCVTTVLLDISFVCDRWLRHRGRLTPNGSPGQKALAVLMILFAIAGTAGLILLSIFDVAHHNHLHDGFLVLFIGGYMISAIFACWEYQRLGIHNRQVFVLRLSFWLKLSFILIELALAVAFAVLGYTSRTSKAAIVEWIISFVFTFYVWSFVVDLYPAVHTHKHRDHRFRRPICGAQAAASDMNAHLPGDTDTDTDATANAEAACGADDSIHRPTTASEMQQVTGDVYSQSASRATRAPRSSGWTPNTQEPDVQPGRAY